ncbi:plasmid mobilization protein [Falsiroseomonas sp.]|uniref:plasmid mobilization protein n=1 Tax=Falsiroseomonas sp. TaxID=2870721 RepID=UPI003F70B23A
MSSIPPQSPLERRTESIRLVLTPVEHTIITERARMAGKSVSAFLRDLGLQAPVAPAIARDAIVKAIQLIEMLRDHCDRLEALPPLSELAEPQRQEVLSKLKRLLAEIEDLVLPR